jgi:hypothetical protein
MTDLSKLSIAELAALICEALKKRRVAGNIVGGSVRRNLQQ